MNADMPAAKNVAELLDQIRTDYDNLSKRLQQVAQYVTHNQNSVAFDTIAVIAEKADVPPSTMIRFASSFGFAGFNEMKQLFRDKLLEETPSYTERAKMTKAFVAEATPADRSRKILTDFAEATIVSLKNLNDTILPENLQRAIDLLSDASTIYIAGMGRSFSLAVSLRYALYHLERSVVMVDGLGGMHREQMNQVTSNDVIVAISYAPYSSQTRAAAEAAKKAGAGLIVMTDSQISPIATLGDVCFAIDEPHIDAFRSTSATQCLIQSIVVALAYQISNKAPEAEK